MGLQKGDRIPSFSLKSQTGSIFHSASLIGLKPLVIFFYPRDYTPGCTAEVCAFRDEYSEIITLGAEVIGISSDSSTMHDGFASKYKLPYLLLSDTENHVKKMFMVRNRLFNLLPARETYVVNRAGIVEIVCRSLMPGEHVRVAIKALGKMNAS